MRLFGFAFGILLLLIFCVGFARESGPNQGTTALGSAPSSVLAEGGESGVRDSHHNQAGIAAVLGGLILLPLGLLVVAAHSHPERQWDGPYGFGSGPESEADHSGKILGVVLAVGGAVSLIGGLSSLAH